MKPRRLRPRVLVLPVILICALTNSSEAALDVIWVPANPEIGENVVFTLSGLTGAPSQVTWNFGGPGCDGASATQICTPGLFDDCHARAFRYASGGEKPVSVSVELEGGGTQSVGPRIVTILFSGSCPDNCTYNLSASSAVFDNYGGLGQFTVITSTGCDWLATTDAQWIVITSDSGTGSGIVIYQVSTNQSLYSRSETIAAEGKNFEVCQDGTFERCDGCPHVLPEPGFEGGSGAAWSESSSSGYFLVTMNRPHTGLFSAWLGGAQGEISSVSQVVTIDPSATSALLSYWYWIDSSSDCGRGGATINGVTARGHDYDLCVSLNTEGYVESDVIDLLPYAGIPTEISFFADSTGAVSSLYVDDVSLEVCGPISPPGTIFSDGFESGSTAAWSGSEPPSI